MREITFAQKCRDCDEVLTYVAHERTDRSDAVDMSLHWDENPAAAAHFKTHLKVKD